MGRILLLFALLIAAAPVAAQSFANCTKVNTESADFCPDQGTASTAVSSIGAQINAGAFSGYGPGKTTTGPLIVDLPSRTVYAFIKSPSGSNIARVIRQWPVGQGCSAKAPLTSGWSSLGNGAFCDGGCASGPASSGEQMTVAGRVYFSLSGAKPTGGSCAVGDGSGTGVTSDQCTQQGSLTQCVKSDGRQCAVASSGKQFCWSPGEAGTKSSGNEGATKSPASANINPPKTPPANGGDWQQTGQSTSSTTSGGATTNYNVTGWGSSYGSQGSGGGGEGEGEGDGDGYGSPGEGVGDIYEPSDKTVESVFSDFKGKVQDAPIFKSATGFLGGCSGGGQCPNETWDGGMWAGKFDLSQLCSGALGSLMNYAGFVFLAAMGAVGFRWALL